MENGKASGEDEVTFDMIKAVGDAREKWLQRLLCWIKLGYQMTGEWACLCFFGRVKGDANDPSTYWAASPLSQLLKILQRVLEVRLEVQDKGKYRSGANMVLGRERSTRDAHEVSLKDK